jgi:hypothetical protein
LSVVARRVDVVLLQRLILTALTAPDVLTGENLVVTAATLPAQKLRGADGVHRMRAHHRIQNLENRVPRVAARLVLLGLPNELLDAELIAVRLSAGELHLGAHDRVEVLNHQQARSVR